MSLANQRLPDPYSVRERDTESLGGGGHGKRFRLADDGEGR